MASISSSRAALCAAAVAVPLSALAQQAPSPRPAAASSFTVFLNAVPVGIEEIAVTRGADGWTITSSGRMGAPIDLIARRVQVRYDPDWKPLEVTVDSTLRGQVMSLHTTVSGTTATSQITRGDQSSQATDTIDPAAVVLPSPFWGPFEALAARVKTADVGATIPVYGGPQVAYGIRIGDSATEQIQTTERIITARRTKLTLMPPGLPPLDAELWTDETGRLLRVSIAAQNLEVVREDIASVAARRVTVSRANDEQVRVPAIGFSLAGTISKPTGAVVKALPAIVLVGGSGPTDRDELVFNIPIFGQLSSALADAGFLVLRYDKRGVGQSGGRAEAATLADYAEDLRAAVRFVASRKDVDAKRVAVVGHSEGGSVAMLAAAKEKRIAALVLVDAIGVTGAELNLEQVQHVLDRSSRSDAEKQSTIELQKKIQTAVLTGTGWEGIPLQIRKQADIPWFQSFLAFDPAKVMPQVRQPLLIVQSALDTQVPPANADRLAAMARARKKSGAVELVMIPGINHLLVPATTGEVDEYGKLSDQKVSPAVAMAIADWLHKPVTR